MNILFTTENGLTKDIYFPPAALGELEKLGTVSYNNSNIQFNDAQLEAAIAGKEACLTHWSCPTFSPQILNNAGRLRLIAHAAGSVADLVTAEVYKRGIKVCSANTIMAKYVAEGVLAYFLAGLRQIPQHSYDLQQKKIWRKRLLESHSLIGARVGLVGLGTIGRFLLDFLKPFDVHIKVYDPYILPGSLSSFSNVELASLDEALAWGEIVSIHASLTSETRGLLNKDNLVRIKDGALLVNTARAAIIDEPALLDELKKERFQAILDVFNEEPLSHQSPFYGLKNVILMPHVAGIPAREQMTYAMIDEIGRFSRGEPLQFEIPYEKFKLMTKEH